MWRIAMEFNGVPVIQLKNMNIWSHILKYIFLLLF